EPSVRDAVERELAGVDRVVGAEEERDGQEAEHDDRADHDHDAARQLDLGEAERHQADDRGEGGAESVGQSDDETEDLPGAAPEQVAEHPQLQSEKLCNHSRPSTTLRPPASSTNFSSSDPSPRTSSTVPDASTEPSTMIA